MLGDVEMQDTAAIVTDDEEAVEHAKGDRGHGEEVHGRNRFPVIRKKCAPALGWLGISRNPLHPAGDGSLGIEAQHEQFTVNARRAPGWVLRHQPEDQLPHFHRQFLPTDRFSRLRDPTPVQSKPSAMPANDRLRVHEHERLLPGTPETTGEYPEDFVNRSHRGSGMLALQHSQLLPESEIFQEQASMRSKAAGEQAQPKSDVATHEAPVIADAARLRKVCKLLISEPDRILAMHSLDYRTFSSYFYLTLFFTEIEFSVGTITKTARTLGWARERRDTEFAA